MCFRAKASDQKVFVAGGFAEVMPSRCTVLAEQAVDLETLDADALRQEIRALDEKIKRGERLMGQSQLPKPNSLQKQNYTPCFPGLFLCLGYICCLIPISCVAILKIPLGK